ncbi:MAG: response regulator transcription factor [Bryobacteraceae bacterium]
MENSPSLLLVDDDEELCELMREFFAGQGLPVEVAHNGRAGLEMARSGRYDLLLLDVMMPEMDGFAVLRALRPDSDIPVLMLTARTDGPSRIEGLNSGADDYLPKPFDPHELVARVRAILRRAKPSGGPTTGVTPAGQQLIEISGVRLDTGARGVRIEGQAVELTSVEFEILHTLMTAAGRVVSRDELMQRLYQRESTPFDRSIDVHVSHLRKKLDRGRPVIVTVRGVGYQFCAETQG